MSVGTKGRCAAYSRVVQAMNGTVVPAGTRVAQERKGAIYVPFIMQHARNAGIEHGTEVGYLLHQETGALVVLPPGVTIDDFEEQERA